MRPSGRLDGELALPQSARTAIRSLEGFQTRAFEKLLTASQAGWANDPDRSDSVLVRKDTGIVLLALDGDPVRNPSAITHPATPFPLAAFVNHLASKGVEDNIPHMYLDSRDKITVGVGHLLVSESAAVTAHAALKFTVRRTGKFATIAEVKAEWLTIRSLRGKVSNPRAGSFSTHTKLETTRAAALALARKDFSTLTGRVTGGNPYSKSEFESLPANVQMSIADMVFTLGQAGFRGFSLFIQATKCRDFATAAANSKRKGGPPNRHTIILSWLNGSAQRFFISTDPTEAKKRQQLRLDGSLHERALSTPYKPQP